MICVKTEQFKLNRKILLLIGLWPYERTRLVHLQVILVYGVLISSFLYQLAALVFTKCTPTLVINIFSITLLVGTCLFLYNSFWINIRSMKNVLGELQNVYNDLKDENEIAIITKYGKDAKRFTVLFVLLQVVNLCSFLLLGIILQFTSVSLTDESDSHNMIEKLIPKFFIGQEDYMYLILPYVMVYSIIGGIVLLGTGTMVAACFKHTCGMFRIASYRIEKAMMVNITEKTMKTENLICTKIIYAVNIHRKAIEFCMNLFTTFKGYLFFLIVNNVICLSLNLYMITETMLHEGNIEQCYLHFIISYGLFVMLFIANYFGEDIYDHNNLVFSTAYNVRWYLAPLQIQKLILFLLQNGSKALRPPIGGIFSLSLELFATLSKTSLSYFTVVYSMQM